MKKFDYYFISKKEKRSENQDRFTIIEDLFGYFYAVVFDGHAGSVSASYVANGLHILIKEYLSDKCKSLIVLKKAFIKVNDELHKEKIKDGTMSQLMKFQNCYKALS